MSGPDGPSPGDPESARHLADDLRSVARVLAAASDIVILGHVRPDADALGSALALGTALARRGSRVAVSFGVRDQAGSLDCAPTSLVALDEYGLLVPPAEVPAAPEVLVACDTADRGRLGLLADRLDTAGTTVLIDHHASNPGFARHRLLDPGAEATSILVYRLLREMELPIDPVVGRCLYAGIATDTVGFRVGGPDPHRIAADLVEAGVAVEPLMQALSGSHPFAWLATLGEILRTARLEPEAAGGVGLVHATVPHPVLRAFRPEEVESVIDHVRTASEAEVAAVLKQVAPRRWAVSLRARGGFDVSVAAMALGGGGHRSAAGYTTEGTRTEVLEKLRATLTAVAG